MQAGEAGEPLLCLSRHRPDWLLVAEQQVPAHRVCEVRCSGTGLATVGELLGQHQHAAGAEVKSLICCLSTATWPLPAKRGWDSKWSRVRRYPVTVSMRISGGSCRTGAIWVPARFPGQGDGRAAHTVRTARGRRVPSRGSSVRERRARRPPHWRYDGALVPSSARPIRVTCAIRAVSRHRSRSRRVPSRGLALPGARPVLPGMHLCSQVSLSHDSPLPVN